MARRGQRQSGARRTAPRNQRRVRDLDNEGIIPVLARAVREVETAVQRGPVMPSVRTKFQVVALLVREERARVKADDDAAPRPSAPSSSSGSTASPRSWRRPPPATPRCSRCSPRTPSSPTRPAPLKREMLRGRRPRGAARGGRPARAGRRGRPPRTERRVVPAVGRLPAAGQPVPRPRLLRRRRPRSGPRRLAGWELLGPLFRSFEYAGGGASACMALPEPTVAARRPAACELMPHQAQVVAAAAAGHRTFLLADEPGLGKTAQALLAAQAAERLPAARRRAERREDQLGPRGRALDAEPPGHRDPRRRRRRSTASPTSSSSTTRCSTGTSAGSATSASAAWSSTRRTSSRTRPRSARSTCCSSPSGSGPGSPGRC